jgi:hypothetical protein
MPTSEQQGSTSTATGTLPVQDDRTLAPVLDRSGVDHWQRRLDRARATKHLRQPDE